MDLLSIPTQDLDILRVGDCLPGLESLPDASIDLAFCDPPFNVGYGYDIYQDDRSSSDYVAWCRKWGTQVGRVLKPTGSFWLAIGDEFAAELKVAMHRNVGLSLRSWVVWYYTFGVNCTNKFTRSHVHLFHFVKDPARFHFDPDAIRVPSARQVVYGDKRAKKGGRLPDDTWILRPQDVPGGFAPDSDTWCVSRVCGTFKERQGNHPCQMPEAVLGRIIRSCSREGDVVLDPFAGSGTTLAVAKKLRRRWLGWELSEAYAAGARARINSAAPGDPIPGEDPWWSGKPEPAATTPA